MHTQKRRKCHENSKRSVILWSFDLVFHFPRVARHRTDFEAQLLLNQALQLVYAETIIIIFPRLGLSSLPIGGCVMYRPTSMCTSKFFFFLHCSENHVEMGFYFFIGNFMQKSIKTFSTF